MIDHSFIMGIEKGTRHLGGAENGKREHGLDSEKFQSLMSYRRSAAAASLVPFPPSLAVSTWAASLPSCLTADSHMNERKYG